MPDDNQRKMTLAAARNRRDKLRGQDWRVPGEETAGKLVFRLVAATCIGALAVAALATGIEASL